MGLFAPVVEELPLARCEVCGREVLCHVAYDDGSGEERLCVHCDAPVRTATAAAGGEDLAEHGYAFVEERGGCGSGGCGSGGCSRRGA
jgi:hypothetical protein